jgi:hypothetical protein
MATNPLDNIVASPLPEPINPPWPPVNSPAGTTGPLIKNPAYFLALSTNLLLSASAVLNGPVIDRFALIPLSAAAPAHNVQYAKIPVGVFAMAKSDQAGSLVLQQSEDLVHWTATVTQAVAATTTATVALTPLTAQYYQWVYTNGSTAQKYFRLMVGEDYNINEVS